MYFEKCVRYVLRCHLLAKNIANTYGVTHVQEEVVYCGTYLLFLQVVSKSFDSTVVSTVAYVYASRFMVM
jgi:hypothetical protein